MIRDILTDLAYLAIPALIGVLLWVWSVNMGIVPPICGVCALRLEMARYESIGPEFMDIENRELNDF